MEPLDSDMANDPPPRKTITQRNELPIGFHGKDYSNKLSYSSIQAENSIYFINFRFQSTEKRAPASIDTMPQFLQSLNGAERLRFG